MKTHIMLITGSGSENSHTLALVRYIAALLQKQGVKTTIWDLQKNPLPFSDPDFHGDPAHPNKEVRRFIHEVANAQGIVLGTPLYHGTFSGVLKNALDNLGSDAFKNKHVGLVSNAGGGGNIQAVEQLRSVIRSLYGYALQTQIVSTEDDYTTIEGIKAVQNTSIKDRAKRLVDELVFFTTLMQQNNLQ